MKEEKMKDNPIEILIVDDHTLFRQGLCSILEGEKGLKIVEEAKDGLEAVEKAKKLFPDVVLMDIALPKLDGVEATRRIKKENPKINVVMLTVHADQSHVFEALKAGATGYILKDVDAEKMIEIIHTVSNGEAVIQPHIATQLLKEFQRLPKGAQTIEGQKIGIYSTLTNREKQILKLVALAKTNKEVASSLSIREKTVKNHLSNIFQKLQMNTRTQLALYAYRRGLVR